MLVVNYFTKQAILLHLDAEFMGLQTVCCNFCDLLTMAFTAAGMVMLFQLYKPLESNDREKTAEVFRYFRKVFRVLTAVSIPAGGVLSALTVFSVNMRISDGLVLFYFWLYLLGVLTYNRFLNNYYMLMADQKRYVASGICGTVDVAALVLEIFALTATQRYGLFLCVIIGKNLLETGLIMLYRRRSYGYLSDKTVSTLSGVERKRIRRNIGDMVISKIGTLLLYNTDSVIISAMVSTAISGYYSCYYFVSYGLQFTMTAVFDTLMPKFGRLSVTGSKSSQYRNYILVSLANIVCTTVCVAGFYLLSKDFLLLWMGESVLLGSRLPVIISINLYITLSRYTSSAFRQAEGLFQKISWVILFRGIFNVFLSIALGWKSGLLGIIAATAISDGLTVFWYEPYMMLRFYKRKQTFEFLYQILGLFSVFTTIWILGWITALMPMVSWGCFALKILIVAGGAVLWNAFLGAILFLVFRFRKEQVCRLLDLDDEETDERIPPHKDGEKPLKLSFVIPVYNGAGYIRNSIEAVLSEKNTDLELLIVDDGSTDDTCQVAESIAGADPRVRVIRIENHGQSYARNIGIQYATGDYITFADADDTVLWDGIHTMLAIANERTWDVVCGNYVQIDQNNSYPGLTDIPSGEVTHDDRKKSIYQSIKTRSAFGYCWNKLYRTAFIKDNGLCFDDARKVFMEDSLFNHKLFALSPRFYYCDVPVYNYYIRHLTASRKREAGIAQMYCNMLANYSDFLKQNHLYEENLDLLVPLLMRIFCWSLGREVSLTGKLSRGSLHERICAFTREACFREVVSDIKNIRKLDRIPSFPQRIVYRICFRILNKGQEKIIPQVYVLGYPIIRIYLKHKQIK